MPSVEDLLKQKVLQTHVLVCVLCYLSNGSIRFPIHRHLNGKTAEKYSKQQKDTNNFNKEFTLFSRATSPVQLQWWPCFIVSLSRELQIHGLNASSPETGLLGRVVVGFPKPLRVHRLLFFLPVL